MKYVCGFTSLVFPGPFPFVVFWSEQIYKVAKILEGTYFWKSVLKEKPFFCMMMFFRSLQDGGLITPPPALSEVP